MTMDRLREFTRRSCVGVVLVVATGVGAAAGAQELKLIPRPRQVSGGGSLPLSSGLQIRCESCTAEDRFTRENLEATLEERGIARSAAGGVVLELVHGSGEPAGFTPAMHDEGYSIEVLPHGLRVTGLSSAGLFYGVQTATQLMTGHGAEAVLHTATIRDWPAMRYRGLDDDLSRGPVPTLLFQEKMIRVLAAYKMNVYSPYFEQTMQYAGQALPAVPNGSMSAADARELVRYAAQFHITVIPEQEAFGHLHHTLIWEQYQPLAETAHGAVLAPGQAGSLALIKQWFGELAEIFPSPFLHIGADETVDLGLGQTKADVDSRGLGAVYLDFLRNITEALAPLHRKLLFWGDIAMNSPDLVKAMPESFKQATIAVPWEYGEQPRGFDRFITPFTKGGYETWVAPGVNNWSRVYPNYNVGLLNIQGFIRDGQRLGADGALTTIWNDDGEGLFNMDWYGILFGAAAAWQPGESSTAQFEESYAQVFHGDGTGALNEAEKELMAAHALLHDQAKTGDGSDGLFWMDPWSKDGVVYADKIRPFTHEVRLHAERALTLIAQARAAAPPMQGAAHAETGAEEYPSAASSLRETDAVDALELGARRMDFLALKFQLADEMRQDYAKATEEQGSTDKKARTDVAHELGEINNGANGRIQDLRDGYSLLRDMYRQAWLRSNRPYALRPVLERYDYTIQMWIGRSDKMRAAQRQWSETHTLPSAAEVGIPGTPGPAAGALPNAGGVQ